VVCSVSELIWTTNVMDIRRTLWKRDPPIVRHISLHCNAEKVSPKWRLALTYYTHVHAHAHTQLSSKDWIARLSYCWPVSRHLPSFVVWGGRYWIFLYFLSEPCQSLAYCDHITLLISISLHWKGACNSSCCELTSHRNKLNLSGFSSYWLDFSYKLRISNSVLSHSGTIHL
jgi:hypothetical protein